MKPDLFLIANAGVARLFTRGSANDRLVPLSSLDHPEGHIKASDLGDDRLGHGSTDNRPGGVSFTPRTDPRRKEDLRFAHLLAQRIDQALASGECAHVRLYASNPFLGELKQALSPHARQALREAVDLDLTSFGVDEIERRIAHHAAQGSQAAQS